MSKGCKLLCSIMESLRCNASSEESFSSMEGLSSPTTVKPCWFSGPIDTVEEFIKILDHLYAKNIPWEDTKAAISCLLRRLDLTTNETNKYTFWDAEKSYTRNLIHTDNKNYTLLLLCWNAGKESKIHNHPCNGCFVKTIRGCVRENRYHDVDGIIKQSSVRFFTEGQVSYMDDYIGYHKIGNPQKDSGSVSLHLYTPPYSECKVWSDDGCEAKRFEIGKMGYFSYKGHRTPALEGHPGTHARLMKEISKRLSCIVKQDSDNEVTNEVTTECTSNSCNGMVKSPSCNVMQNVTSPKQQNCKTYDVASNGTVTICDTPLSCSEHKSSMPLASH